MISLWIVWYGRAIPFVLFLLTDSYSFFLELSASHGWIAVYHMTKILYNVLLADDKKLLQTSSSFKIDLLIVLTIHGSCNNHCLHHISNASIHTLSNVFIIHDSKPYRNIENTRVVHLTVGPNLSNSTPLFQWLNKLFTAYFCLDGRLEIQDTQILSPFQFVEVSSVIGEQGKTYPYDITSSLITI